MTVAQPARRDVLRTTLAAGAVAASGLLGHAKAQQAGQVRWSSGTEPPKLKAPADATDCHFHLYDSSFPIAPYATLKPPPASVDDYQALRQRLGVTRGVLIQPSTYGTDNRPYLGLLPKLGTDRTRMVAVVNTSVSDAELQEMHAAGVRGIRFNLAPPGATTIDMLEPLSRRVGPMGWHCQINMPGTQILAAQDLFMRIPGKLVFDHLAHVPEPDGVNSPVFVLIRKLLDKGNAWVKLSGAYADTKLGPPTYADSTAVAKAYVQAAPQRLVWGSDWPHPTEAADKKPDDAVLFDLLAEWVPDEATRHRVLVENPAELYDFPKS
jgi:predicted TIM-barrel fold metal-dependent hydrolase